MWKPNPPSSSATPTPTEPVRTATPVASAAYEAPTTRTASPAAPAATGDQATIGKSLMIKGEISGSESLYVDGRIEGNINLPGNRVTVGRNGQVAANIAAREIIVLGKVRGNCQASDRIDIRAEGSVTGDVIAARISIEDGAFFKGGIDIRKAGEAPAAKTPDTYSTGSKSRNSSYQAAAVESYSQPSESSSSTEDYGATSAQGTIPIGSAS